MMYMASGRNYVYDTVKNRDRQPDRAAVEGQHDKKFQRVAHDGRGDDADEDAASSAGGGAGVHHHQVGEIRMPLHPPIIGAFGAVPLQAAKVQTTMTHAGTSACRRPKVGKSASSSVMNPTKRGKPITSARMLTIGF